MDYNLILLDRVKLLMEYDSSYTRTENVKLILEKPDEMMPGQIERFGYKIDDPSTLGPALKKQSQYFQDVASYFKTWNKHDWMDLAALASWFIPYVGPYLAVTIDLINAGTYISEGQNFEAGLRIAFAVIPFGTIINKIPLVKKFGKSATIKLFGRFSRLSSSERMAKLTYEELKLLDDLEAAAPWLRQTAGGHIFEEFVRLSIEKSTIWSFTRLIQLYSLKFPIQYWLTKTIAYLYGVSWTYTKVAKYFGLEASDCANNIYGFQKFCKLLEITYISYDEKTGKGYAMCKNESNTKSEKMEFEYDAQRKCFKNTVIDSTLTSEEVTEKMTTTLTDEINKKAKENNINYDSMYADLANQITQDTILSTQFQTNSTNNAVSQSEVSTDNSTELSKQGISKETAVNKITATQEYWQIPAEMDTIKAFQYYVWVRVEKDAQKEEGSCDANGQNCSYKSALCGNNFCKYRKAVDGSWGKGTKNAWNLYKDRYFKDGFFVYSSLQDVINALK